MNDEATRAQRRGRWQLLLLVSVFVVPILAALVINAAGWVPAPARQHGELLQPPLDLRGESLALADGERYAWNPEARLWRLVALPSDDCDAACRQVAADIDKVWRLLGHDADRQAERIFRLSRVVGEVRVVGRPGAYEIPEDTDIREIARRLAPPSSTTTAVLLVRADAGQAFRRIATSVTPVEHGPDDCTAWDRVEVVRPAVGLADDVLAQGADVVLLEPEAVRDQVVARLEQLEVVR